MPAIGRVFPKKDKAFWDSFDPDDYRTVAEALKEEFHRPEPAYNIHYFANRSPNVPITVADAGVGCACLQDCLVFVLRGGFSIKGQGLCIADGCVYRVKNEEWMWLGGKGTVFVMEEGKMRGICQRNVEEAHVKMTINQASNTRRFYMQNIMRKIRRPKPEEAQCSPQ